MGGLRDIRDKHHYDKLDFKTLTKWTHKEVGDWLRFKGHKEMYIKTICEIEKVDGKGLLLLTENDLKEPPIRISVLGELKSLYFDILELQHSVNVYISGHGPSLHSLQVECGNSELRKFNKRKRKAHRVSFEPSSDSEISELISDNPDGSSTGGREPLKSSPSHHSNHYERAVSGYATNLEPEVWKAVLAMLYVFVVTWITALVMVIVHDRVPDMEKYPPLPDLFLDNMPHISWAFEMCEVTGTILFCLWMGVLFFHKHRFILLRRFFALSGTVFLLRCFTMLITSLSVPGTHLQCNPRVMPYGDWLSRLYNAYLIWKGAGMSIQGVRTCGDYMFSGHTVALTMLNFFVTEYTTRRLYYVHTFSWLLNMFGIFFILAAHEHYSIDVFIAFYITSRLFLYYHTLANNQALMARDSKRTKIWFPLFSYFEAGVDGIVPNQYEWPITLRRIRRCVASFLKQAEVKWRGLPNPHEFLRVNNFLRPSASNLFKKQT